MTFRLPLCLFNRHAPNRNRVKWDGLHFVSTCRYCSKPVRRLDKGRWRADWMQNSAKTETAASAPDPDDNSQS